MCKQFYVLIDIKEIGESIQLFHGCDCMDEREIWSLLI